MQPLYISEPTHHVKDETHSTQTRHSDHYNQSYRLSNEDNKRENIAF